jgi:hypothetical protein
MMLTNGSTTRIPLQFGRVPLPRTVEAFREEMNAEMMALLQTLPASTHVDAVVFFRKHLGTTFFPVFDFFRHYYAPAWSILYWLEQHPAVAPALKMADRNHARTAHAMALFLHLLDDHLYDGQLPVSHLSLLLRSQAWMQMNTAFTQLAAGVDGGVKLVQDFIDAYYASIGSPPTPDNLDGYCRHFCRQMATGMIVPVLMADKLTGDDQFSAALQEAYGAFGIAWRLLDDVQDMEADMRSGNHSGIYYALPLNVRSSWGQTTQSDKVRAAVHCNGILTTIKERIYHELASAAAKMEINQMTGLAEEFRRLARPLKARSTSS